MLKGHVFSNQTFSNNIFALFMNTFLAGHNGIINGYKNSMNVTYSGSSVTVASGALCVQGRFLEEDSSRTIDAGTNTLYCKLVLTINLTRENTSSTFNQGYYEILTSASGYPNLTQNNIVNTGTGVYQYELARFRTGLSGITDFVDKRTFLDFNSIYEELEQQSTLATKSEVEELDTTLRGIIATKADTSTVNSNLAGKLDKTGGTLTGALASRKISPSADKTYDLGSAGALWRYLYAMQLILPNSTVFAAGSSSIFGVLEQLSIRSNSDLNVMRPISASAFNVNSSRRYKENINDMTEEEANKILDVDVKMFDYKKRENGTNVAGVIAEEVYNILPNVVTLANVDGNEMPDSVDYSKFVPYLIKEIQMLKKEVDELKGQNYE